MSAIPQPLFEPLRRLAAGDLPANVAVMQLCMAARSPAEVESAIGSALETLDGTQARRDRLLAARRIVEEDPWAFDLVKQVVVAFDHGEAGGAETVARVAAAYDRLAEQWPEASVALYSLGDPARLEASTAEIVDWLRARGVLGRGRAGLEVGCGTGRFLRALAPEMGGLVGLDVSRVMVARARAATAGLANVRARQTAGRDLAGIADASLDLMLLVDSFPYLVQAGLAETHVAEAARVLRPGGDLVVLNWSYRGDPDQDRAQARAWADRRGFTVLAQGERPFALWDGATFHLRRN